MPNRYIPKLYNPIIGVQTSSIPKIRERSNRSPNRKDKYERMIFQKNNTAETVRNTTDNRIPEGFVVLGGGKMMYRSEVNKNQHSVGISV